MPIVSDSGPILSFGKAHSLNVLRDVVGEIYIPVAVYDELTLDRQKPAAKQIARASWIKQRDISDRSLMDQLSVRLHIGEQEALALALEMSASLLIDEKEARKEARRLGIPHFGSLKVLQVAKDRGQIKTVKVTLDQMIKAGMYIDEQLYATFLKQIGELSSN